MKEYVYKNIVLKPRVTNYISYRIPSIEFKEKFKKYKKEKIGDIDDRFNEELIKATLKSKEIRKASQINDKEKYEDILFEENPELFTEFIIQDINKKEFLERFFLENNLENTKILFNIVFENEKDMKYDINTEEDYKEFYDLVMDVFNDFFFSKQLKKVT
ncbi:MAG: hypothetical protein PHN88_09200 [Ignavibacteria bacterium]|nr:hypothetical protein [Ignavibacteria bacterium]